MIRPEAGPQRDGKRVGVPALGEGQHFIEQVVFVLPLPPGTGTGMFPFAVPGFVIDAADHHHVPPALANAVADDVHHPAVFPFMEAAEGGGEHDDGGPAVAEFEEFHVSVERWTPPAVILSVHGCRSYPECR